MVYLGMGNIRGTCTDIDGTTYALIVRGDPAVRLFVWEDGKEKACLGCMYLDPQELSEPMPMVEWAGENILLRPQIITWFLEEGGRILK